MDREQSQLWCKLTKQELLNNMFIVGENTTIPKIEKCDITIIGI
jgi:hypothetical protein